MCFTKQTIYSCDHAGPVKLHKPCLKGWEWRYSVCVDRDETRDIAELSYACDLCRARSAGIEQRYLRAKRDQEKKLQKEADKHRMTRKVLKGETDQELWDRLLAERDPKWLGDIDYNAGK
jgi:hypothetical protein